MIDDGEGLFQSQKNGWHNQHQQSGLDLLVDDSWQEQQQQHESSLTSPGSTYAISLLYQHSNLSCITLLIVFLRLLCLYRSSNGETVATHIKAYFENFHPSLPILHRPTFTISSTPKPLLTITAVIGSLYCVFPHDNTDSDEGRACNQWRETVWENGYLELQRLVIFSAFDLKKLFHLLIVTSRYLSTLRNFARHGSLKRGSCISSTERIWAILRNLRRREIC